LTSYEHDRRALSAKFEHLTFDLNDGDDGDFISGWQCENDFIAATVAAVQERANKSDRTRYTFFEAQSELRTAIKELHKVRDGNEPESVVCGGGTTSLLFAFATYLKSIGTSRIYYIPPLYISLHIAFDAYGIEAVPVSTGQPYEPDFELMLPRDPGSILILTDPVWYAGVRIPQWVIAELIAWQQEMAALIFVDGSLQYLRWDGSDHEMSSGFVSGLTFRLICPSKQLCIHGYRFSYLLLPQSCERTFAWTYTNTFGAAASDSVAFGYEAIAALGRGEVARSLMAVASTRYEHLTKIGAIESSLRPNCGYFAFARINATLPENHLRLDGDYFAQQKYPGYCKINLLSPSIAMLTRNVCVRPVQQHRAVDAVEGLHCASLSTRFA
jgi:aspartate/methionine/tyrosine aminotransferase